VKSEAGTIAVLVATYLSIILVAIFGSAAVVAALVAANRVQGVAEMAVLFAHDRSVELGVPDSAELTVELEQFLSLAPSAHALELVAVDSYVTGAVSTVRICARYLNPLGVGIDSAIICRESRAESFLIGK